MTTQYVGGRGRTGMRGISDMSLLVKDLADNFTGLKKGVSKGNVLSAFKRASVALDIHPRHVFAIDKLMGFSFEQDWEDHQRPIVWPSNERLQEELGLSRRMVQYTIRQLIDLQLIAPIDSPTGKRYGHRDRMGFITEAYGFDLSPMATRFEEFIAVAEQAETVRKERSKLRRQITIAKKDILRIASAALEDGLAGGDWEDWANEALEIAGRVPSCTVPEQLSHLLEALQGRLEIAEQALRRAVLPVDNSTHPGDNPSSSDNDIASEGAMDCAHNTTTTHLKNNIHYTSVDTSKGLPEKSSSLVQTMERKSRDLDAQIMVSDGMDQYKITPNLVSYACPDIALGFFEDNPSWDDILNSAHHFKTSLGVSQTIWGEACQVLGRYGAAVAMAIVVTKRHELRSPGGYFRGMVNKARACELNLGPTLYALRDIRDGGGKTKKAYVQGQNPQSTRDSSLFENLRDRSWAQEDVFSSIGKLTDQFRRRRD